jgi:hypothetical protein
MSGGAGSLAEKKGSCEILVGKSSFAYDRGRTAVNELVKFNISVLLV